MYYSGTLQNNRNSFKTKRGITLGFSNKDGYRKEIFYLGI